MALTPGQRIDLKKKITATLGQQEWREIDLTLGEFGFPTEDDWRGDSESYALAMLQAGGSDESLAQLDGYLHPTAGPTAPPQPDSFDDQASPWVGQGFRLFLSHIHQNRGQAGALRAELARRSIDAFVAHDLIKPTEDWRDVILSALRSCDGCLALLSPGFPKSEWTDQEVGFCVARGVLVVPVECGLKPYGFLGKYQALPVRAGQSPVDIALAVYEVLVRNEQSRDAMARAIVSRWAMTARALVSRWAMTGSYDAARENYSFLKTIPREAWTQRLVDEVWQARERNAELRDANINWQPSDKALDDLFRELPFSRPSTVDAASDDDIPF